MTTITKIYTDTAKQDVTIEPRARRGGPRRPRVTQTREAWTDRMTNITFGSHMPIDTKIHWDWANPLNIIPLALVLLFLLAVIESLV